MPAPKYLIFDTSTGLLKHVPAVQTGPSADSIVSTGSDGVIDPSLLPTEFRGGNITIDLQASEALSAKDVVNIFVSSGVTKVRKAVVDGNGKYAHGVVLSSASVNSQVTVYTRAKVTVSISFMTIPPAPGKYVYLSNLAGVMTTDLQSDYFNQKVGTILNTDGPDYVVHFWPDAPVLM
jgi:hypothetical protein